ASRSLDSLRNVVAADERMLSALTGPRVRVVELASAGVRAPSARMFWDQATSRWTFFAHNLKPPAQGRTYQLWLVTTANAKVSAGVFTPWQGGDAVVRAEY